MAQSYPLRQRACGLSTAIILLSVLAPGVLGGCVEFCGGAERRCASAQLWRRKARGGRGR